VSVMLSGVDRSQLDLAAYRQELEVMMAKYRGASIADIQLGPLLQAMIEVSIRHGAPLPASLALAAKSLSQMQLVAAQLDPTLEPFDVAGKFLTRSLLQDMIPKGDLKTLVYESQKLKVRVTRVFEAVEQMVGTKPGEKPGMNVPTTSLEDTVRMASRPLALGFAAGFAMLASAITATHRSHGDPAIGHPAAPLTYTLFSSARNRGPAFLHPPRW
jgi:ubiquinone biosynthesis protein